MEKLTIAFAKGRILEEAVPLFEKAGIPVTPLKNPGRQLIFDQDKFRFMIIRAADVPVFVKYGAADLGVVGKDTLLENDFNLFELLDLKIGVCRISVATISGRRIDRERILRIATKYPNITKNYFAGRGKQVEIIKLYGSMELAPVAGLADAIVDLVSTGRTLRENGLEEVEIIEPYISSYLVANRNLFYVRNELIAEVVRRLRSVLED